MRLAILGDPVSHSLSPAMHEAALAQSGITGSYRRIRVSRANLPTIVGQLKRKEYHGFNVTLPHKEAILQLLSGADETATTIGAANTVVSDGGALRGHNTDASGLRRVLAENGVAAGAQAMILGAGGAARACLHVLLSQGWSVTVANRGADRAKPFASRATVIELADVAAVQRALEGATLLVNATPVGMNRPEESPIGDRIRLPSCLTVIDLVYVPLHTRLLEDARRAECRTVDGLALLAAQASDSFEIWTGIRLPDSFFRDAAMEGAMLSDARRFQLGFVPSSGGAPW